MNLQEEKTTLSNILQRQETVNFYSLVFSLLMIIIVLLIYALNYIELPAKIPLFYSLSWGEKQLVSLSQFIILPALMILIVLINLILSWHLHSSQKTLKRIISISTALITLLFFLASFKIIYLFV